MSVVTAIHGFSRPERSATAPKTGADMATAPSEIPSAKPQSSAPLEPGPATIWLKYVGKTKVTMIAAKAELAQS
jgi:hypothetical protein